MRGKKGDASDIVTFLIIVFFLGVSFLVVSFANNEFSNIIKETKLNSTPVASSVTDKLDTITSTTLQKTFVFIVAMLIIGMMISAFMVDVHPVFLFIYIFILAITLFITAPLSNTYESLMNVDTLNPIASQQTMTNWIMEHLVGIMLGVGALSMIILFGKLRGGPGLSGGSSDF